MGYIQFVKTNKERPGLLRIWKSDLKDMPWLVGFLRLAKALGLVEEYRNFYEVDISNINITPEEIYRPP